MSQVQKRPNAGLRLDSVKERPDRVPLEKGEYSVASRALALSTYFLSGALAINLSQFLGTPLYLVNQDWYNAWIAFTKQSFGLLTMTLTQAFAPTKVIVSGDASVRGQLQVSSDGNLVLNFPSRIIMMANHQIYTDWLYLWWIAYCNGMHGRLYIILKESLKRIPILGWGMQMSQFIFLKRNWEKDKPHMSSALQKLNTSSEPMWLMLFPEGTNLAPSTREKSAAWAAKTGTKDMMHTLLPRTTGLQFCLQELSKSVDYLYDCTVAYEGVPRGQFAQDIFTLKAGYLEGRPPKSVHMYWRRYAIKNIPIHNDKAFELWLMARWREKDLLIENYLQTGRFPADRGATKLASSGAIIRGTGHSCVQIRSSHWYEFLQIFAPMGVLAMILAVFYGALPKSFWKSFNKQALASNTQDIKQASQQVATSAKTATNNISSLTLDDIFDKDKQEDSFKKGAYAVQSWLQTPNAQKMLNRVDFATQFLQNPEQTVRNTVKSQRKDFMHAIQAEEQRRKQLHLPTSAQNTGPQKGRFWKDLDRLEHSRQSSVVSAPISSSTTNQNRIKPVGTFYADLQAAERRRQGQSQGQGQGLDYAVRGTFWDQIKAEEQSRAGGTLSDTNSSSGGMGYARTLPSTPSTISRASSAMPRLVGVGRGGGISATNSTVSSRPPKLGLRRASAAASTAGSLGPKKLAVKEGKTTSSEAGKPLKLASTSAPTSAPAPAPRKAVPVAKPAVVKNQPSKLLSVVSKDATSGTADKGGGSAQPVQKSTGPAVKGESAGPPKLGVQGAAVKHPTGTPKLGISGEKKASPPKLVSNS